MFETTATIDNGSGNSDHCFETGRLALQAAGAVVAYLDDDQHAAVGDHRQQEPQRTLRLFPWSTSRSACMRAGRTSVRSSVASGPTPPTRHPDLAGSSTAPAAPGSFGRRAAQRDPNRGDDPQPGSGRSLRRIGDQRGVGVHPAGRSAVLGPIKVRWRSSTVPVGFPPSTRSSAPCSTWSWPGRIVEVMLAIMMVEAEHRKQRSRRGGAQAPTESVVAAGLRRLSCLSPRCAPRSRSLPMPLESRANRPSTSRFPTTAKRYYSVLGGHRRWPPR